MANNYTVSTFTAIETAGDSADPSNSFSNTMVTSGTLTITPNTGYLVKASDFKVGSTLPDNIDSVVFTDSGTIGALENTVIATVSINKDFVMPSENVTFNIDIDGATTLFSAQDINSVVIIEDDKEWNTNFKTGVRINRSFINAEATITPSSGVSVVEFDNMIGVSPPPSRHRVTHTLSTSVKSGTSTEIATIHIKATDNYYFPRIPYLLPNKISNGKIKLTQTSVTKDSSGLITDYYFKLKYKNNVETSIDDNLRATLVYNAFEKRSSIITPEIVKEEFGNSTINYNGEIRPIRVYTRGEAEFELTLSRKSTSASILSSSNTNSEVLDPVSGALGSLKKKIVRTRNRNYYSFYQEFPSSIIKRTLVNGSKTTSTTVVFDSTTGVKVGDQLFSSDRSSVPIGTPVKVTSVNTDGVTLVFDTAVTITDDSKVYFARADEYYLNIEAGENTTLSSSIPAMTIAQPVTANSVERRSYNYLLNQYLNPVLKLTVSSADTTHLELNGAADIVYEGRVNASRKEIETISTIPTRFNISYSLTPKGGHSVINELSSPTLKFSNTELTTTDASGASVISSHWTNSVSADNGGTVIYISNITQSGTGTGTYTITAEVNVLKWGTKSVTMNLDLDQIIDTA